AHYALGSVGEWMMGTIVGIHPQPFAPGFKRIRLTPQPGGALTSARGAYESIHGRIELGWKIEGDRVKLDVLVPANTTAVLNLPTSEPYSVEEAGKPVVRSLGERPSAGISLIELPVGAPVLELSSGRFQLAVKR